MLHDERRTSDYIAALREAVRPDDVVLDIGTGSGVLAVAAARAGARHVYAVEASDIADVAKRVFAENAVQDRITLIRGWSREIELPERADVLVAELIGNEPFEEEILETTLDARRRLLKPGGRLIPHTLELLARPLLIPEAEARQRAIGRRAIERWRSLARDRTGGRCPPERPGFATSKGDPGESVGCGPGQVPPGGHQSDSCHGDVRREDRHAAVHLAEHVKSHTRDLNRKLGATSKAEAVARAEPLGLLSHRITRVILPRGGPNGRQRRAC